MAVSLRRSRPAFQHDNQASSVNGLYSGRDCDAALAQPASAPAVQTQPVETTAFIAAQ